MNKVTISMDEDLAGWLRVEAAKAGKSASRFVADILAAKRGVPTRQREALDRFLAGPELPGASEILRDRSLMYDEALLHRHERSGLRPRSARTKKAS